ncbi:MAG: hypothetical protein K0R24_1886 [Gammaproteobacteria bacterium]|nr:hypothetical protein [Gammaproteobacteria bacterium]
MDNMMEEIIGRKCDKQDTSLNSSDIRSHFKEFDSQVASLEKLIHPTNRERAFFNYNKLYNSKLSRDHRCTRICEYGKTHEVSEKINLLLNELIPHTGREPEEDRFMHLEECDWRLMHTYLDVILPRSNARQKTIEEMLLQGNGNEKGANFPREIFNIVAEYGDGYSAGEEQIKPVPMKISGKATPLVAKAQSNLRLV